MTTILIISLLLNIVLIVALLIKHDKLSILKIPKQQKQRKWTAADWGHLAFDKPEPL
jgi:hypothetical protein